MSRTKRRKRELLKRRNYVKWKNWPDGAKINFTSETEVGLGVMEFAETMLAKERLMKGVQLFVDRS